MVKIISKDNGILFDTTAIRPVGATFAKKMFRPKNYPNIELISLFDDYIHGVSASGDDFKINFVESSEAIEKGIYPVSEVAGVTVTSLDDLYDKFISSL